MLLKQAFDQGPQGARGIIDDVAELVVLAVDVAQNVNGALR